MPNSPKKACCFPGCGAATYDRYCDKHKPVIKQRELAIKKQVDERRGSAQQRGYTGRWQKARATYLMKHPLCAECLKHNKYTTATVVDHIVPHKGDQELFWDTDNNWQPLCRYHHNAKTMRERGGA